MSVLNRVIPEAVANALRALELGSAAHVLEPEIMVVLEEALLLDVTLCLGPLSELRQRLSDCDESLRSAIVDRIESNLRSIDDSFVHDLCAHPRVNLDWELLRLWLVDSPSSASRLLRLRMAQRAFERVIGERIAPPLRVRWPHALSRTEVTSELPGLYTHAAIVGELIGAVEEIFPLILDAYSVDLRRSGKARLNVIGVHESWLDAKGRAARIVYYHHATHALYETDVAEPIAFDSCQFLYLGRDEARVHKRLAFKLESCLQLNSPEISSCCDDKYRTAELLRGAGIRAPKATLLTGHLAPETIRDQLESAGLSDCSSIVAQPNRGTEGEGVAVVTLGQPQSISDLARLLDSLYEHEHDEILVRERIECFRLAVQKQRLATSIRINVFWDGLQGHAESAYVQIAGEAQPDISSIGRGGTIGTLSEGILEKVGISPAEMTLACGAANGAVAAINRETNPSGRLGLFGVDVLLERSDNGPLAWILEINPRPAGLSHSDFLDTGEPGVSTALFESLTNRLIGTCDRTDIPQRASPP